MAQQRHRPLPYRALALALSTVLSLADPAAALAHNSRPDGTRAALAAERYYSSYGDPPARAETISAALAAEHYLSSYGTPRPLARPTTPAATADAGPTWTTAFLVGALLIIAAAVLGVVAGRASARERRSTA